MFQRTCGHVTTALKHCGFTREQMTGALKSGGVNDPFDDEPKKHTALLNIKASA